MSIRAAKMFAIRRAALMVLLSLALSCDSSGSKGPGVLQELRVSPTVVLLRDRTSPFQLQVTGITSTGKTRDLTSSSEGTRYLSTDPAVATVSAEGLVTPAGPGSGLIGISNGAIVSSIPVRSDFTPALTEGDFDLVALSVPIQKGSTVAIPLVVNAGVLGLGSYRVRVTYDPAQLHLVFVGAGVDLGAPTAVRKDTPGEIEFSNAHNPAGGPSPTGKIEVAKILLRVIGDDGQESIITGQALGVSTDEFPAGPIGPPTPRGFVTGVRRLVIVE
ncbi:MAG: hypothetical protein O7H41_18270 [Planctomycetota bacterium]|nr:hypothetical protein [Planctomycetota bacterium]